MRVLLIAMSLPLVVAAAEPAKKPPAKPPIARKLCAPAGTTNAQDGVADGMRVRGVRKLSEMPPARQILTVIRTIDGCDTPVVVRENIGGN